MTAPLSAQRVEALREWLGRLHGQGYSPSAIADLYVLCDDYSSMRAALEKPRNVTMGLVHDRLREVGIEVKP
jgi:hypothetical protein